MATIVTRDGKGSALTYAEADANFTNLNDDKSEVGHAHVIADVTGLQAAIDGKQASGSYAAAVHSHVAADVTDFATAVAATAAVTANTAKATNATHTGDVTGSGALTIAADAVTYAKMQNVSAASKLIGRGDSGAGDPQEITLGAGLTMTGTTLSFSGGGGSPGGASGEVQYNNGGAFAGAADVEIEGGQLRLPVIATPTAPAADGVKMFGRKMGGRVMPAFMGPSGLDSSLQPHFGRNRVAIARPVGNNAAMQLLGMLTAVTGTPTLANVATTNRHTRMARLEYLVTVAAIAAVAGFRAGSLQYTLGASTAGDGGFHMVYRWAPATGVTIATHRAFAGMRASVAAATDVEPSTLTNICGMGWDAADANIQFMHNDGAGTATKINLGASFPVPAVDRTSVYEITLFAPPGTTQSLSYEVADLVSGAVATGTVTTDIPATTQLLAPYNYMSVGGTSSVVGIAVMGLYVESDY